MSKISKTLKKISRVRLQRKRRVRSIVSGDAKRPRLVVQRSLRHFRAQLIDDTTGKTIVSVASDGLEKLSGIEQAKKVGQNLAEGAKKAGISGVVFDRRYYRYHGRVKVFAEAARESGLQF